MNRALLIIYEPALFLLAALGWAGWELWSMRTRKSETALKSDSHMTPAAAQTSTHEDRATTPAQNGS